VPHRRKYMRNILEKVIDGVELTALAVGLIIWVTLALIGIVLLIGAP
jgi:hypothetical protein